MKRFVKKNVPSKCQCGHEMRCHQGNCVCMKQTEACLEGENYIRRLSTDYYNKIWKAL